ncbi:hypothetical protein BCR33DRAFT_714950 [Rhizoclosmatium globosum]|uniref:Uncharacterized protein n=1 Tax=Rhizoclosmatium globosum TaxID=329046 RepID=A0A1Y2CLK0_9FUNG|nr:hypothetical protein BCR33DRAFT_714950 [Rhizoclosmatium globosum]|eukprot:ORY47901.1 hypothetical protein BCR33DRAFT_714950 [Rhizoclosmatium globosum]
MAFLQAVQQYSPNQDFNPFSTFTQELAMSVANSGNIHSQIPSISHSSSEPFKRYSYSSAPSSKRTSAPKKTTPKKDTSTPGPEKKTLVSISFKNIANKGIRNGASANTPVTPVPSAASNSLKARLAEKIKAKVQDFCQNRFVENHGKRYEPVAPPMTQVSQHVHRGGQQDDGLDWEAELAGLGVGVNSQTHMQDLNGLYRGESSSSFTGSFVGLSGNSVLESISEVSPMMSEKVIGSKKGGASRNTPKLNAKEVRDTKKPAPRQTPRRKATQAPSPITPVQSNQSSTPQPTSAPSSSIIPHASLPPCIDTSTPSDHLQHETQEYTPYSATSTSSTFPVGYQMLYLPVQVPLSPTDAFLSPPTTDAASSTPTKKRPRRGDSGQTSPVVQGGTPVTPGQKEAASTTQRQLSLGSLFHPTLQSQLSNGQLLAQLGLGTPSLGGLFPSSAASTGAGGVSTEGGGGVSGTPIVGVWVPQGGCRKVESDILDGLDKVQSPVCGTVDAGAGAGGGASPLQWAFLQQKELQLMALQLASAGSNSGGSGEATTACPPSLLRSGSLSFLFNVGGSIPPAIPEEDEDDILAPSHNTRTANKRKRSGSIKGKERLVDDIVGNGNTLPTGALQEQFQFIQLQPEQLEQLQQQQELLQKLYYQQIMEQQNQSQASSGTNVPKQDSVTTKGIFTPLLGFSSSDWLNFSNPGSISDSSATSNAKDAPALQSQGQNQMWGFGYVPVTEASGTRSAFIPFKEGGSLMLGPGINMLPLGGSGEYSPGMGVLLGLPGMPTTTSSATKSNQQFQL